MSSHQQLRVLVEQLQREANIERMKTSDAINHLKVCILSLLLWDAFSLIVHLFAGLRGDSHILVRLLCLVIWISVLLSEAFFVSEVYGLEKKDPPV